ncbi:MAG: iron-sulfur cluster assembly scaffold protein [Candidatus Aminicenantes bacterium]|nr:iron-sulfur cluster assembly scaffold protein [Candidatus Aminicenantes bacterium]
MDERDEVERFQRELQEQILEDLRRTYSPVAIDHWMHPRNFRSLEDPDGYARVQGSCGDTMEMFLRVRDGRILECGFQTDGCGPTIICGSVVTELAAGKTFVEALATVSTSEILRIVGGLPESHLHCARLASETMRRALADYQYHQQAPWGKKYRKT